jgi:hypothetical protein
MEIRIVKSSDVAACPKTSLLPGHYRDDGSCRCDEREIAKAEVDRLRTEVNVEIARLRAVYTAACERLRRT